MRLEHPQCMRLELHLWNMRPVRSASQKQVSVQKGLMEKVKLAKQHVKKGNHISWKGAGILQNVLNMLYKIQGIGTHGFCKQYYATQSGYLPNYFCTLFPPRTSASYRTLRLKRTAYFSRSFRESFHFMQECDRVRLYLTR